VPPSGHKASLPSHFFAKRRAPIPKLQGSAFENHGDQIFTKIKKKTKNAATLSKTNGISITSEPNSPKTKYFLRKTDLFGQKVLFYAKLIFWEKLKLSQK